MRKISAGVMMYRVRNGSLQVLLVHPGGPFWQKKDDGSWTFPRGEVGADEEPESAAKREFQEETGCVPHGPFIPLGNVRHRSGKIVHAWAFEGDLDPSLVRSNTFKIEWPPKSGQQKEFPEIDRASFYDVTTASNKILSAELPLLEKLQQILEKRGLSRTVMAFRESLFE